MLPSRCCLFSTRSIERPAATIRLGKVDPEEELASWLPPLPRRSFLLTPIALQFIIPPAFVSARMPGANDVESSLSQIKEGFVTLKQLQKDWNEYTTIDKEGRAGDVDRARRILGGVSKQNEPSTSPLYKLEGAFAAIRKASLAADEDSKDALERQLAAMDVEEFVEATEIIAYNLQKADYQFYSCAFAPGGTRQVQELYDSSRVFVDRSVIEYAKVLSLLP